jgi:hypothetical protein
MIPGRFTEPASWPGFLPPSLGTAMFGPDGLLWIPRAVAAGKPSALRHHRRSSSCGSTTTDCNTCSARVTNYLAHDRAAVNA